MGRKMTFSELVILSGAETSRSEVSAESKDPYSIQQAQRASINRQLR